MKFKNLITFSLIAVLSLSFNACADLDVENVNNPDTANALSSPSDLVGLVQGGMVDLSWTILTFQNVNFDLQADIITSTNAFSNYWGDADEPRRRIDNTTTFDDKANIEYIWTGCNAAVTIANDIIRFVDSGNNFDDTDQGTNKMLAAAYFMKGLAQGYISMIYDKGFVVDADSDLLALEFVSYQDMLAASLSNLDQAIALFSANADANFDWITDSNLTNEEAAALCRTYAARFIAGNARTSAERAGLNWAAVKSYAEGGLQSDYSPTSDENIIYNGQHSWNTFVVDAEGAAYLPTDLHICNLADPSYPKSYPTTPGEFLGEVTTDDARFGTFDDGVQHDFEFTPSVGWLREDRNRSIFSNYTFQRYAYDYAVSNTGNPMHIVTASENQMLLAEAELHLGNNAACKAVIDAGDRTTRGGLPALADDSFDTLADAIYYENIVGNHSNGSAIALAYMRRWDRLQEGSYLHLPVPAFELEILGESLYTFGGAGRGGEEGTADGSNAWK